MKKGIIILFFLLISLLINGAGTGLAFSGGGARGFAHIGVLKVLDEAGIKIDQISGTSAGALVASLYACGFSGKEIEELVLQIDWEKFIDDQVERDKKMINFKHWQEGSNLSLRLQNLTPVLPEGVIPGNSIINEFFKLTWGFCDCVDFDSLSIPLRIPATDVISGKTEVFSSGNLHEVIFASFCFPTLLQPFALNGTYYIDGGILMNLPVEPLVEMGADFVIGVGANSTLKKSAEINSIIDILEQTAGIAMKSNIQESQIECDVLIEPDLSEFSMLRFEDIKEIIAAGEEAARKALPLLANLPRRETERDKKVSVTSRIYINKIEIEGNEYLKNSEIMSYLDLETGHNYSLSEISHAFEQAFNSDLFQLIYPVIEREEDGYRLIVKVLEKHRSYLKMNLCYNTTDNISLRLLTDYKNLIQPNSRLLGCLEVGENNNFCLDYVKNFGNNFGLYYHLFPYIREVPIYTYDDEFMKINSVQAVETGGTAGTGIFFQRSLIMELYGFMYDKNLYRDIGVELNDLRFRSWGGGVKLYFETLDDLIFGMKGIKLLSKYSIARSEDGDNEKFQKSFLKFELLHPLTNWMSVRYRFEYGSYFDKAIPYDPFYIGGMDSFLGLHCYQRSSSVYKINSISMRFNPMKDFYLETLLNNLNLGNTDNWEIGDALEWAGGIIVGYQFPLIPVRLGLAIDELDQLTGYVNIGYSLDVFEFSRW